MGDSMVETYLAEEHSDVLSDAVANEEWFLKIKELGLTGQANLSDKTVSPIPFSPMTPGMRAVYSTLCPVVDSVEDYSADTIPLRVLAIIALCATQKYFARIRVWHSVAKPDPILVGSTKTSTWDSGNQEFLLARWGDELRSFPELYQLAERQLIDERKLALQSAISTCEVDVNKFLNGKRFDLQRLSE
jgi:hypothetical protein